ncbi:MAG: phage portal protein [Clostridium sp.]|nr:phage portal protein [Clostridium sp.]DAE51675.1 MAG TPA: portal protein [Caudoviricetes sp.]
MSIKTWLMDFLGANINKGKIVDDVIENELQEIYYKELAIQTAITLISNAISKCEIKVYEKNKEVKNKLYYTLNVEANKNENSSQLWHKAIEKMIYRNESLLININEDFYCADSYACDEYPIKGNIYKGISVGNLQLNRTFKSDEVLRLQLNNAHIKKLIDRLYEQYGELLSYAAKNYKKSNGTKYKLILDQVKASDEKFQETYREVVQKQLKDFIENENAVYPQYKGYDLQDVSPTANKDSSDFRNLRKEMFEIVAQAFQIPVSLMLGNITNMNEITKTFLTFCIDPIADMISEEITRKTSGNYNNWVKGNYVKVDTSTINHIDILDVAEKADKLIASGTCCIDEVREIIGFDKLNTEFSMKHFITKNYDTAENRLIGDEQNNKGGE